jgi:Ca2+-binding RTX toxin-like protein
LIDAGEDTIALTVEQASNIREVLVGDYTIVDSADNVSAELENGTDSDSLLGKATLIDAGADPIALTVEQASNIREALVGDYTIVDSADNVSAELENGTEAGTLLGEAASIDAGADPIALTVEQASNIREVLVGDYTIVDSAENVSAELENGTGSESLLGKATLIDTTDDQAVSLNVAQAIEISSRFFDGYKVVDASSAVISELESPADEAILGEATSVTANGTEEGETIDLSIFSNFQSLVIDGQQGDDTLLGSVFADLIYGGDGSDVIRGGLGADVMWGGDGANPDTDSDTFTYSASKNTASTSASYSVNNTTFSISSSDMDVIHGDVSDVIDLIGTSGWSTINGAVVQTNGSIDKRTFATTGKDAVVFKDGADFYLAFETSNGSAGVFGSLEIIKLVDIVTQDSRFSLEASSNLTFIA